MSQTLGRMIRRRTLMVVVVPILLLALVLMLVAGLGRWQAQQQQREQALQLLTEQVAASVDYALLADQPQLVQGTLKQLLSQPGVQEVRIRNEHGQLWLRRQQALAVSGSSSLPVRQVTALVVSPALPAAAEDWLSEWPDTDRVVGQVEVDLAAQGLGPDEWMMLWQLVLLTLLGAALAALVAYQQSSRLLRYLERLRTTAESERRQRQQALQARELRWQEEQQRQQLWGQWSHDVRTPLHGVTGMLELLETTRLDAEQREYVQQARAAAKAMMSGLQACPLPPTALAEFPDEVALQRARQRWAGRQVLVVEDDLVSQRVVHGMLSAWGALVVIADTGQAGLAESQRLWDLVLLDGELPDMDAVRFAQAWRAGRGARDPVPLVLVTAHTEPARLQAYEHAGLGPVLHKPLRQRHLLSVLTPLLTD